MVAVYLVGWELEWSILLFSLVSFPSFFLKEIFDGELSMWLAIYQMLHCCLLALLFCFAFFGFMFEDLKVFYPIFQLQLGNHGSNLTEEELETHTISAWKEGKAHLNRQVAGNLRSFSSHLIHVSNFMVDLIDAPCIISWSIILVCFICFFYHVI